MWIRPLGRRFLLLHSYRDGRGKVCQRRLYDFGERAGLAQALENWSAFQADLSGRCPELKVDWDALRAGGEKALARFEEALPAIMMGLARDRRLVRPDNPYWSTCGELWPENSRRLLGIVAKQHIVRHFLNRIGDSGPRVRGLVPRTAMESLARRVWTLWTGS